MDPITRQINWLHSLTQEEREEYMRDVAAAIKKAAEMPSETLDQCVDRVRVASIHLGEVERKWKRRRCPKDENNT